MELWTARSPTLDKDPCGNHRLHEISKDGSLKRAVEKLTGMEITELDEATCRAAAKGNAVDAEVVVIRIVPWKRLNAMYLEYKKMCISSQSINL